MRNQPPTDQDVGLERRARAEWQSLLARLQATAAESERLGRVRDAIASGEFQVDARAIAGRLIARFLAS